MAGIQGGETYFAWAIEARNTLYLACVAILIASPIALIGAFMYFEIWSLGRLLVLSGYFLAGWVALAFLNRLFYYPARSYVITPYTLVVSRGGKSATYRWDDFDSFSVAGMRRHHLAFYIKSKRGTIVVLYTEPEREEALRYTFLHYMPEIPPGMGEAAFTHFEFK